VTATFDVRWPIAQSGWIPLGHPYPLFAALASLVPEIHGNERVGIHLIRGIRSAPGRLELTKNSAVALRTPIDFLPRLMVLSGKKLTLAGCSIRLGVPELHPIMPAERLFSRVVTIKGFQDPENFAKAATRQLEHLGIRSSVHMEIGQRRVVQVKGNTIVGFSLQLDSLTDEESVSVQTEGIGGRRRLGCGLFLRVLRSAIPQQREHS
jgi:CRISPR-associated protein Cas6